MSIDWFLLGLLCMYFVSDHPCPPQVDVKPSQEKRSGDNVLGLCWWGWGSGDRSFQSAVRL